MCSRIARKYQAQALADEFDVKEYLDERPELSDELSDDLLLPTARAPIIVEEGGRRIVKVASWWYIAPWSKTGEPDKWATFNARSDKIADPKSLFFRSFKAQRCLVPVSAFYEYKGAKPKDKVPYLICVKDKPMFALAGLWSHWSPPKDAPTDKAPFDSFTVVTTEPNALVSTIHNRMPVILDRKDYAQWLDPANEDIESLAKLLVPFPAERMSAEEQPKPEHAPRAAKPAKSAKPVPSTEADQGLLF
jgi:putative SOS response-associated peptidase YedK